MDKIERVNAALKGQTVDRVPISVWGHNYLKEWSAQGLAEAMLENYQTWDWDWMKVNPRASYHVEDWGATLQPSGDANKGPSFTTVPVQEPADFRRLKPLDPHAGVLGEQLDALRQIKTGMRGTAYFIQTIFSPLSIAKYLAGNNAQPIKTVIADDPGALKAGLEVITATFTDYVQACLEAGAAGIFFATTGWACATALTEDEYKRWGRDYDLALLQAAAGKAPFNVLHNCGSGIYFDLLADYPVEAISWAATLPGNPTLDEARGKTSKALMGGLSEKTVLVDGTPEQVAAEVDAAIAQTHGRGLLLAPGCSIPPRTPARNLEAAKVADREAKLAF
jgi:uroporphyrinogen decarboxylase